MSTPELDHMRAWGERWGREVAERSGAHRVGDLAVTDEAAETFFGAIVGVVADEAERIMGLWREETGELPPREFMEAWMMAALRGYGAGLNAPKP